ncbi:unnamed protein product [Rotaria sordida]|uniref:Uncharacterized protein n=1 Tax=Rotaria sordida TaxID=392033 RepID=A0A815JMQ3_9BILA|nr:unnamed protein product [Rotaria sordida]CAF1381524.1 unnamed protein product [Rotaria sordida]
MSGNNDMVSVVDDEESMIKYLREKIIGRPTIFSLGGDVPIDDHTPPIKKANSQDGLNDVVLISTSSNDTTNQTVT